MLGSDLSERVRELTASREAAVDVAAEDRRQSVSDRRPNSLGAADEAVTRGGRLSVAGI
jgi:hypothetical protein